VSERDDFFRSELERRGITRRDFAKFCGTMAGILSLPAAAAAQIEDAILTRRKPALIWLEFQDCAGDTESLLRATSPTAAEAVLDVLSLDYHETIMAAAGHRAEQARENTMRELRGQYIAVVEGSIPTGANGAYCTIGGKSALQIAREVCGNALATINVGTCSCFGGLPAAYPNPTGALSTAEAVPDAATIINLPACPVNVENLTATLVHFLTYERWPDLDHLSRPLFAYGRTIHDNCERRAHYDSGQFARAWGDDGHRAGYCLYEMGCKGPVTYHNCPNIEWNGRTSWPVACGHPCIGCAEPDFWDRMTPFYTHIPGIPGLGPAASVDKVGALLAGGTAVAFGGHALVQLGLRKWRGRKEAVAAEAAAKKPPEPEPTPAVASAELEKGAAE
jgi:hydrogenase small subunit